MKREDIKFVGRIILIAKFHSLSSLISAAIKELNEESITFWQMVCKSYNFN